jgi:hypothetical protein
MTSYQLERKLAQAIDLIADCERYLEDPYAQERHWELVHLKDRARDFMDLHRDQLREGGAL